MIEVSKSGVSSKGCEETCKIVSASRLNFCGAAKVKGSRSHLELEDKVVGCRRRSQGLFKGIESLEVKHQEGSRGQSVR